MQYISPATNRLLKSALLAVSMMSFLSSFARAARTLRSIPSRRLASSIASQPTRKSYRSLAFGAAFGVAAYLTLSSNGVHMESPVEKFKSPVVPVIPEEDTMSKC